MKPSIVVAALCILGGTACAPPPADTTTTAPPVTPSPSAAAPAPAPAEPLFPPLAVTEPPAGLEFCDSAAVPVVAAKRTGATQSAGTLDVVSREPSGSLHVETVPPGAAADPDAVAVGPAAVMSASLDVEQQAVPNDPGYPQQWSLAALSAPQVWQRATGAGVNIAVIDSGVDPTHPDLKGKVVAGPAILRGVQSDAGGCTPGTAHGTHVAGIAAGVANNAAGIVGFAPAANIVAVRVLDSSGRGLTSDVANGIIWAADHGADVINLSLGSSTDATSVNAAIDYATDHDVIVVAAAGNGGPSGAPQYPAAANKAVAVSATASNGDWASFSTAGAYVDVAAPGALIYSAVPGGWKHMSGTSMAAPHVAALAALARERDPGITQDQFLASVAATATDAGPPGFDTMYGHGVINPLGLLATP